MKQKQQGDVLFSSISKLPSNLKAAKRTKRGYVLADGETTGHAHVIEDLDSVDVFVAEDGNLFLRVKEAAVVTHEEHKPVTLEPGFYEVGRVQEVDPFSEAIRAVKD